MAYDPEWDDDRFPSLDEIYRKDNIIEFNQRTKNIILKPLNTLIDGIIKDRQFQKYVFDENVLDFKSKSFSKIISLMKRCAIELLDKMLLQVLGGIVDREVLNDLAGACLSLAIKLYGAHDWISTGSVLNTMIYIARNKGINLDIRLMNIMERDIMKNTNWKGCPTFYLDKTYDSMFQDENFEMTESDYLKMLKKGSNMLAEIEGRAVVELVLGEHEGIGLPPGFYLKYKNEYYDVDTVDDIPMKQMNIVVDLSIVSRLAKKKKLTFQQVLDWLRDRVVKERFKIIPISFKYKSDLSYNMSKSRRASRRVSRKVSRKSKKSRKVSRRVSRRKSRKSRKVSRKSRKSRKVSRRTSRRTRRASRKSRRRV